MISGIICGFIAKYEVDRTRTDVSTTYDIDIVKTTVDQLMMLLLKLGVRQLVLNSTTLSTTDADPAAQSRF